MARLKTPIDDPEYAKAVAELYVNGMPAREMAEHFDHSPTTIRNWIKDPRVQAHARRMAVDRVTRITRRIDNEIENRLNNIDEWDIGDVLKVRKEFLDRPLKLEEGDNTDIAKATNELAEALDSNPEFLKFVQGITAND